MSKATAPGLKKSKNSGANFYVWIIRRITAYKLTTHAGHVTLFIIVSIFPFLMMLIKTASLIFPDMDKLIDIIGKNATGQLGKLVVSWIREVYNSPTSIVYILTIVGTLWSGSKGFDGLAAGLDSIYRTEKKRTYPKRRSLAIVYTCFFIVMIISSIAILFLGSYLARRLESAFPEWGESHLFFKITMMILVYIVFLSFFIFIYRIIPAAEKVGGRKRTIRTELPGALVASLTWIVFTKIYSWYVNYQITKSSLYGSLTAVFFMMLWLYFCMIFLFVGGLLNNYRYEFNESPFRHLISDIPGIFKLIPIFKKKTKGDPTKYS